MLVVMVHNEKQLVSTAPPVSTTLALPKSSRVETKIHQPKAEVTFWRIDYSKNAAEYERKFQQLLMMKIERK
jgi:hypothetical protein